MKIKINRAAYLIRAASSWGAESSQERTREATVRLIADAVRAEREACAQAALKAIEQCSIKPVSMSEIGKCVLSAIRSGG